MAQSDVVKFDAPQTGWRELWEGPIQFRATKAKGRFGPGTPLSQMEEYGRNNSEWLYRVTVDPDDGGAIEIAWQIGFPGVSPPYSKPRYYNGGPGRGLCERLRNDGVLRASPFYFGHLPPEYHDRAVGAYAVAVTIREWMEREFFTAVEAGECVVWARAGSKTAPFIIVPADVFIAYSITSWGFDKRGGGAASLEGAPELYSIYLALPDAVDRMPKEAVTSLPEIPSDSAIKAKMLELRGGGMTRDEAAKAINKCPGFERVGNELARRTVANELPRGRPKKQRNK